MGAAATARSLALLALVLVSSLALLGASAGDAGVEGDDSPLQLEVEQLRSKALVLESTIKDKTLELKIKDDSIAQMAKIVQEKSEAITLLQRQIESFQKESASSNTEELQKTHAHAAELEEKVEKLKDELQAQIQNKVLLEARVHDAMKKTEELTLQLDSAQKTNDELKKKIHKIDRALKVAEEELMKAQLEATAKKKELAQVYEAWLPPWLATHVGNCQDFASTHWYQHGKPTVDVFLQKVSKMSDQIQKHVEPHLKIVKTKWLPAAKEKWIAFSIFVKPHAQHLSIRAVELYQTSLATIKPRLVRFQESAKPYFQEAKRFSKPYVDQVAIFTKPHVEKVHVVLKPYTNKVVHQYRKLLKSATYYHHQVQSVVRAGLKKYELTEALATKEFVWFAASACLALPVYLSGWIIFSTICGKKVRKPAQESHASHVHRRHKRRHVDK